MSCLDKAHTSPEESQSEKSSDEPVASEAKAEEFSKWQAGNKDNTGLKDITPLQ